MGIEDVKDTWCNAIGDINKTIYAKAVEEGIVKQLNYQFDEFDMKDTYMTDGATCYLCMKGLKCKKHTYVRKNQMKENKEILDFTAFGIKRPKPT